MSDYAHAKTRQQVTDDYEREIQRLRAELDALRTAARPILEVLGECDHFDHHGYCQTHFVSDPCEVGELARVLGGKP